VKETADHSALGAGVDALVDHSEELSDGWKGMPHTPWPASEDTAPPSDYGDPDLSRQCRGTDCPAEASRGEGSSVMRILVATDGSPHAMRAAHAAARLVRDLREAEVVIVCVQHLTPTEAAAVGATAASGYADVLGVGAEMQSIAERASATTAAVFDGCGAPVTRQHPRGQPAAQIIDAATAAQADIIVIGRRGLNSVGELFLGSVSQQVLHAAPCPVLIVP